MQNTSLLERERERGTSLAGMRQADERNPSVLYNNDCFIIIIMIKS